MMDPTRAYDDEFFAQGPPKGDESGGARPSLFPRKSTVAISLAVIGSALLLARGFWYLNDDQNQTQHTARIGGGHLFFMSGGSGYRGGSPARSIGGSARGGFGATGAHAAGVAG